jgi:uncharacterized membrane protein
MKLDKVQKTAHLCLIIYLFILCLSFICFDMIFNSESTGLLIIAIICSIQFIIHLIILIPMLIKQEHMELRNKYGFCR